MSVTIGFFFQVKLSSEQLSFCVQYWFPLFQLTGGRAGSDFWTLEMDILASRLSSAILLLCNLQQIT